jgi:hypothetical protein
MWRTCMRFWVLRAVNINFAVLWDWRRVVWWTAIYIWEELLNFIRQDMQASTWQRLACRMPWNFTVNFTVSIKILTAVSLKTKSFWIWYPVDWCMVTGVSGWLATYKDGGSYLTYLQHCTMSSAEDRNTVEVLCEISPVFCYWMVLRCTYLLLDSLLRFRQCTLSPKGRSDQPIADLLCILPAHSVRLPAETFEIRKLLLTLAWQNRDRTSKQFWKHMSCLFMEIYVISPIYLVIMWYKWRYRSQCYELRFLWIFRRVGNIAKSDC